MAPGAHYLVLRDLRAAAACAAATAPFDPAYEYLFNSYYEAVGPRHPRPQRGMLTRPGLAEVMSYRRHVSDAMAALLDGGNQDIDAIVELGLHHEQQHQELILMDAKHLLSLNPLKPAYRASAIVAWCGDTAGAGATSKAGWSRSATTARVSPSTMKGRVTACGWSRSRSASRPTNCGEYLAFIEDGGYRRPEFWLSAGGDCVNQRGWTAPLYWEKDGAGLARLHPVGPAAARSRQHRSVTSAASRPPPSPSGRASACRARREWEAGASALEDTGIVWEWTASPYVAYPGYREPAGAIGEYNGKFMANQMVLRGGCSATPAGHMRPTYRNFFPPDARWMFGGIRLAEDLKMNGSPLLLDRAAAG